jgi:fatty acid/phospholipid biosynthesis enzyme
MPSTVTIALDVMSGDKGSAPAISGALKSLKDNKDLK